MPDNLRKEFVSPSDEYTAVPFWFWNDDLQEEEVIRQINDFKDKGIMGFVIHPRIGMTPNIQYMSEKYLDLVEAAIKEAEKLGMIVFLYDEASYPSGSAHGMVVQGNPEYASRGLKMIEYKCEGESEIELKLDKIISEMEEKVRSALSYKTIFSLAQKMRFVSAQAVRKISEKEIEPTSIKMIMPNNGKVRFNPPDSEEWSILIFIDTPSCGTIRGLHFGEDDGEPGAPPSTDILNPDAVKKFINLTHQRYYDRLKKYFGKTIKAFFTDEPGIMGRRYLPGLKPWTDNFLEWCKENDFNEEDLASLWFETGKDTKIKRGRYLKAVNKKLEMAFYRPISKWCQDHNVALTGHPEKSEDIGVLKHFQIPGQDVVWRWVAPENNLAIEGENSTMGKCSSDAARHTGKRRNSNECLGCCFRNAKKGTTYDLPTEDIKWYLDWLFVRGVNMILPHAFFYSINGERRLNERPPDVGPNNLYWPYYNIISDYIKRMSWLMTDSINVIEIAVLCGYDNLPWRIVKPLLENQIEFNYLENGIFVSDECVIKDGRIKIKAQSYTTLIIEDIDTIDMINVKIRNRLHEFIVRGGNVIILNEKENDINLNGVYKIKDSLQIIDSLNNIIERDVILKPENKDIRVSHVIKNDVNFYLVVNEGEEVFEGNIKLKGTGNIQEWDAVQGKIYDIDSHKVNYESCKYVEFPVKIERRESCIFCIGTAEINNAEYTVDKSTKNKKNEINLTSGWNIKNSPVPVDSTEVLKSWTNWKGMEDYSGTISYYNEFKLDNDIAAISKLESVQIDLGRVCEIAQLFINDHEVGVKLWGPFTFNIKDFIKQGINTVEVKVTNSLANKINKARLDSGLLGPCKVMLEYTK